MVGTHRNLAAEVATVLVLEVALDHRDPSLVVDSSVDVVPEDVDALTDLVVLAGLGNRHLGDLLDLLGLESHHPFDQGALEGLENHRLGGQAGLLGLENHRRVDRGALEGPENRHLGGQVGLLGLENHHLDDLLGLLGQESHHRVDQVALEGLENRHLGGREALVGLEKHLQGDRVALVGQENLHLEASAHHHHHQATADQASVPSCLRASAAMPAALPCEFHHLKTVTMLRTGRRTYNTITLEIYNIS